MEKGEAAVKSNPRTALAQEKMKRIEAYSEKKTGGNMDEISPQRVHGEKARR